MKQCTKCEKEVELSMFGKQSNSKDGLNTWCFNCCKQYQDEYKKSILECLTQTYLMPVLEREKQREDINGNIVN